ncbi:hypothetical protein [Bradyrhizobium sp. CCGUVB14]|uniref:hypothetical protein n=1 Tax=Bradyrhizobium sp. CCGUVB14 TaxID=2949628 RepID=UPI0020B1C4BA|nr:hypothetical protein [Bradyrhizobium sp. CCGUVB14]MCP3444579.1 hypothetical protein [Bradyrhizobium sp. CCGUVB14]
MAKAASDIRSEHPTFPPFTLFVCLVALREEIGAHKGTVTPAKCDCRAAYDEAHFAAIAAEDAIAAECDSAWDNLIAHFETELQRQARGAA